MKNRMTRRAFLRKGSLVIAAFSASGTLDLLNFSRGAAAAEIPFKPHAFLEISTEDVVTVWVGQTNLGQGTHTGIPMVIADELDADWRTVLVKPAPAADAFKDPLWHAQLTGGSTSIRHRWDLLRTVGAAARQMLKQAAANQWNLPVEDCTTKNGRVYHPDGRALSYGQLASAAGTLAVPEKPALKDPRDYRIIGTPRDRLDIPDKVMGRTVFGMDFTLPGMTTAVVARPPAYGAIPETHDKAADMAVTGVTAVIPLENRIAVIAKNTYAAMRGRDALSIKWSKGTLPDMDDAYLDRVYTEYLEKPGAMAVDLNFLVKTSESAILTEASPQLC